MRSIAIFLLALLFFSCKKEEHKSVDNTLKKEVSWDGFYTQARLYKSQEVRGFNYIIEIDADKVFFVNRNKFQYQGSIIKKQGDDLLLKFIIDDKEQIVVLQTDGDSFVAKGEIIENSFLEEDKKYKIANLKFSNAEFQKVYQIKGLTYVSSKNGLVLRSAPTLDSEKKTVLPYKTEVGIIASTENYDVVTSKGQKVFGVWKRVIVQDKENALTGYVFDGFLNYVYEAYSMPYDRSSEDPERRYVDIYTEKQFFENLYKGMTTLNIKAKKLDLIKYLEENPDIYDDSSMGCYIEDDEYVGKQLVFNRYSDFEIRSEIKTELITYPIVIKESHGVLFNNIKFTTPSKNAFEVFNSQTIHFVNIHFKNQLIYIKDCFWLVSFKYCTFSDTQQPILRLNDANVEVRDSNFYNNSTSELIQIDRLLDLGSDFNHSDIDLYNCYIINNSGLENIVDRKDYKGKLYQNLIK